MKDITVWNRVSASEWTCALQKKEISLIIYRLTSLPNFTHQRFGYLCEEADQRTSMVGRKQLTMLRQLHAMGSAWAFSFRLVKTDHLELFLLFRYAGSRPLTKQELDEANAKISNALPQNEYSFRQTEPEACPKQLFSTDWAQRISEICKREGIYHGADYPKELKKPPQEFYVPYLWTAADNTMEQICAALMRHRGNAVLEVTLCPTEYLTDERNWMNVNIRCLRESMNGETLRSPKTGKILWQGEKLPGLKVPVDNCDKLNRQYDAGQVFLTSIRVLAESGADALAEAFLANSVRDTGAILSWQKTDRGFEFLSARYETVDVSADIRTKYWAAHRKEDLPLRAQRLFRLACLEEIATFFRIPIPIRDNFPGFVLDTGLGEKGKEKKPRSLIRLGNYLDVSSARPVPAVFDSQQLAKHGLMVGVPGSGKTTAMFNILYQLWDVPDEQKIPFIVLEPAKTEYRALKLLPALKDDMLVFTLGDESVSPFRFNPMEVLPGIKIENHISRLQACFVGAFNLFDPLPIFLEQAIRRTYLEKGWYDDSCGGDEGVETPTLTDLCRNAEYIVENSGFDAKMKSDFKASLLERLNSLRRGSKGRMLDTLHSIPMEELMGSPVILELDSLNGDEKSLLMMFLLSYVYEYCKIARRSGSPLKHMLLVEEAHNLIGANKSGSDSRADPGEKTIELFVNMLAEMRALGQGILIADQLPTAIAPQAVKQTNVKLLMRVTARDDREEIGNTMDLNEEQMHQVVNFKTGHAYFYHEGEDHVRMIRMRNFKDEYHVEEPPDDRELYGMMHEYELSHPELYHPYPECLHHCTTCNRRVRNQAESYVQRILSDPTALPISDPAVRKTVSFCGLCMMGMVKEAERIRERYKTINDVFGCCVYIHLLHLAETDMAACRKRYKKCTCSQAERQHYLNTYEEKGRKPS